MIQGDDLNGKNGFETSIQFSPSKGGATIEPVTYTWEDIEADAEIVEGSCRNKQTKTNRLLDHGMRSSIIITNQSNLIVP